MVAGMNSSPGPCGVEKVGSWLGDNLGHVVLGWGGVPSGLVLAEILPEATPAFYIYRGVDAWTGSYR